MLTGCNFATQNLNTQLLQLLIINYRGCINHHIAAGVVFWEGDEVSDAVALAEYHAEAVETEGDAAVGWGAKLKGIHQEPKLVLGLFGGKAEAVEHESLQIAVVYADAAATYFESVYD